MTTIDGNSSNVVFLGGLFRRGLDVQPRPLPPGRLPPRLKQAVQIKACYYNAFRLVTDAGGDWHYVLGQFWMREFPFPVPHAWAKSPEGAYYDPTVCLGLRKDPGEHGYLAAMELSTSALLAYAHKHGYPPTLEDVLGPREAAAWLARQHVAGPEGAQETAVTPVGSGYLIR